MHKSTKSAINWYAIYTRSRSEKKVHQYLITEGYTSFLPLMTTVRQWSDRKKKVQLPLIPGYIFVNINEQKLKDLLQLNGIVGILKHLGKPAKIKGYEIENLKILLEDTDSIKFVKDINIKNGDAVIVENGIFKGLIAECVKFKGKHRLIVQIEALANTIEVNIPLSYIKKINQTVKSI